MKTPNRKILDALQTAVSSKDPQWLETVTVQVAQQRDQKQMSDAEFRALDAIIQKAKAGDWKRAQLDSFALCESQRPTSDDLALWKSGGTTKVSTVPESL